ncbi:MAG: acyl-CoA thioesterase [Bacteroidota bacterium]
MTNSTKSFSSVYTVQKEHLDELHHVNNVVYLQFIQSIAQEHWLSITTKEIRETNLWVVMRHEIDYKDQALLGDRLEIITWVDQAKGVRTRRNTEIRHAHTGKVIVVAQTIWCLIDGISKRPKRLTPEFISLFM